VSLRIGNAPCSWGTLEFEQGKGERVSYRQMLDELVEAGYEGTELGDWGFMPTDAEALRRELAQREITLVAAFVPVAFPRAEAHDDGQRRALRTARLLAAVADTPLIVLADDNGQVPERTQQAGRVGPEQGLDKQGWQTFIAGVERIARAVREETGLRTVFHHHSGGYVETPQEVEILMRNTDPELVGLCLDTGHYAFGGGDPMEGLRRYRERIWHVHFKGCDPAVAEAIRASGEDYFEAVHQGVFCALGQGQVDFPAIVSELKRQAYDGWIVVEQDVFPGLGVPLESAQRNRDYLRKLEI